MDQTYTVTIYLKSGNVVVIDNFTKFNIKHNSEEISSIEWTQDLDQGKSGKFLFIDLGRIEYISTKAN